MNETRYLFNGSVTTLAEQDAKVWLSTLFGLTCGFCGDDSGPAMARGLFLLDTTVGRFEADALELAEHKVTPESARFVWHAGESGLQIESDWTFDADNGIWSRKDKIRNNTDHEIMILKALARFVFTCGHYEIYSQASRWSNENQGAWQDLDHGTAVLASEQARSTQGGTPYLFLRERGGASGVAFHILPCGDWTIRAHVQVPFNDAVPFAVVELGQRNENLKWKLPAKSTVELPEILVQGATEPDPRFAAPRLHRHVLKRYFQSAKPHAPVVYNTWFDDFDFLKMDRLHRQLAAAKEAGCEIVMIDAGWFGPEKGNWWEQTGDWREKPHEAFCGKMKDFADQVRAAGLGFGVWMEPERACFNVPVVKEHPDWFVRGPVACYPNLQKKEAYDYILREMSRLVEQYQLAWMKIDFNNHLGVDPSGMEFGGYYQAWYRLLDELRAKYPRVFFEACASGGMRSDINTLMHHDGHFLTDTVEPIDVLRITQGAMLRLIPGRLTKWAVLRCIGPTIPQYPVAMDAVTPTLATAGSATWETAWTTDADFAIRVCMPGMLGFSGDLASLPPKAVERVKFHIEYFKIWRDFIAGSVGHLLTPIRPKEDRGGWVGYQLQHPENTTSLLFAYRLDDQSPKYNFRPRDLDPRRSYTVRNIDHPAEKTRTAKGSDLMADGIVVELGNRFRAAVIEIVPV